ncbi:acyltransferase family protein [Endobacter medicaginis]|uniref:acyltransferase family protein n=1 Tax=Endobacter medicaginis TaxID=1181271 RepID=UPI001C40079E|nr:acyltransferase [Endobacter medicaginis]
MEIAPLSSVASSCTSGAPQTTEPLRGHVRALDGLRAVAVGLVMLVHVSNRRFPGGDVGVDIFFVLSGFLITSILMRELRERGSIHLGAFYLRRALRLMPALVFMVIGDLLMTRFMGAGSAHPVWDAVAALTYTMDVLRASSNYHSWTTLGHTWSLAVEEQFYLLWPWLLLGLTRLGARWRLPALGGAIVAIALWRTHLLLTAPDFARVYFGFDARADQLLIGCALSLWLVQHGAARESVGALARAWPLAVGLIAVFVLRGAPSDPFALSCTMLGIGLCAAVVILSLSQRPGSRFGRVLSLPPLVLLGKWSYGIYLWHFTLLVHLRMDPHLQLKVLASIPLSIAMAALSYHVVERPFLRLKDRFEPAYRPQSGRVRVAN